MKENSSKYNTFNRFELENCKIEEMSLLQKSEDKVPAIRSTRGLRAG